MTAPGTVVFDLDGVIYLDKEGIPGAGAALTRLQDAGWHLRYATNNAMKSPETVVEHIAQRTGFEAVLEDAVTSAVSAARYAAKRHRSVAVVGADQLRSVLEGEGLSVDVSGATAVVVGLDTDLTYTTIDQAARLIRDGAEFIATNTDSTIPTPTGLSPGAGAVVAAIREASGVKPIDCGKPSHHFSTLIESTVSAHPVWMVGDRPNTDIALARAAGWNAILTLTGVVADPSEVPTEWTPDHIVDSIADVPAIILETMRLPQSDEGIMNS